MPNDPDDTRKDEGAEYLRLLSSIEQTEAHCLTSLETLMKKTDGIVLGGKVLIALMSVYEARGESGLRHAVGGWLTEDLIDQLVNFLKEESEKKKSSMEG